MPAGDVVTRLPRGVDECRGGRSARRRPSGPGRGATTTVGAPRPRGRRPAIDAARPSRATASATQRSPVGVPAGDDQGERRSAIGRRRARGRARWRSRSTVVVIAADPSCGQLAATARSANAAGASNWARWPAPSRTVHGRRRRARRAGPRPRDVAGRWPRPTVVSDGDVRRRRAGRRRRRRTPANAGTSARIEGRDRRLESGRRGAHGRRRPTVATRPAQQNAADAAGSLGLGEAVGRARTPRRAGRVQRRRRAVREPRPAAAPTDGAGPAASRPRVAPPLTPDEHTAGRSPRRSMTPTSDDLVAEVSGQASGRRARSPASR